MATKNNLFKLSYTEGLQDGRKLQTNEFIELINNRICFDHKQKNTCDHQACWALVDLKKKVEKN